MLRNIMMVALKEATGKVVMLLLLRLMTLQFQDSIHSTATT